MKNNLPIGVFDSGIGGLTVLKALQSRLPCESFVYLGDTARLPYGTKSPHTVSQYALQATQFLVQKGIKLLVVACNTASAMALPALQASFADIPVIGVVEPGAQAACEVSKSGHIIVAATETTIQNKAYQHAIHHLCPDAVVTGQACSLFVALAEEGWLTGDVAEAAAGRYLLPHFKHKDTAADCLVLGCTHFPALMPTLRKVLGDDIAIVDSARTTADAVARELDLYQISAPNNTISAVQYFATDAPLRFGQVARYFLGQTISCDDVSQVDL